jgi:hypothetical protein
VVGQAAELQIGFRAHHLAKGTQAGLGCCAAFAPVAVGVVMVWLLNNKRRA